MLPKAELHLHLGGSFPLDYLMKVAGEEEKAILNDNLKKASETVSYKEAFQMFKIVSQIVCTEDRVREGTYWLCEALKEDGVAYVEIRTGLKDLGLGFENYLKAVLEGIEKAESPGFKAYVALSLQRNSSLDIAKKTVDLALKYKEKGVIGIDISGYSGEGDIRKILPVLSFAKAKGLGLLIHMGESPLETDQMVILQAITPDRIGHGVHLSEDAKQVILERKIPVEVCLSSSLCVQMIEKLEEHPWLSYGLEGHPIVLASDDPLIFRSPLSREYSLLYEKLNWPMDKILELAENSFKYKLKAE